MNSMLSDYLDKVQRHATIHCKINIHILEHNQIQLNQHSLKYWTLKWLLMSSN